MTIRVKRAYEAPSREDGERILVDRLWPRGVRKDKARVDAWVRDVAPSSQLRKWFGHDPDRWDEFKRRYFRELDAHKERIEALRRQLRGQIVTLLYGTKDTEHNNAAALRDYLTRHRKWRTG
jgi:uncharacterized protein YeaO (DUF488 family)